MKLAFQYVRSVVFIVQMYLVMVILGVIYIPLTLFDKNFAHKAINAYTGWVRWTAAWMVGLKSEVRGEIPEGEVLVASKHQSFFDILVIAHVLKRPKFIMKAQLRYAPIVGWIGKCIGCVPVNRGKRAQAIKKMVEDVKSGHADPGQLVIYPQGTRVAAGAYLPYKIGSAVLYTETGQACVPVATNIGVFWPRHGILRKPGTCVVEFMPRVEPGLETQEFIAHLEEVIEGRSNELMADAGFIVPSRVENTDA